MALKRTSGDSKSVQVWWELQRPGNCENCSVGNLVNPGTENCRERREGWGLVSLLVRFLFVNLTQTKVVQEEEPR